MGMAQEGYDEVGDRENADDSPVMMMMTMIDDNDL